MPRQDCALVSAAALYDTAVIGRSSASMLLLVPAGGGHTRTPELRP